jgi:hypothetical protein
MVGNFGPTALMGCHAGTLAAGRGIAAGIRLGPGIVVIRLDLAATEIGICIDAPPRDIAWRLRDGARMGLLGERACRLAADGTCVSVSRKIQAKGWPGFAGGHAAEVPQGEAGAEAVDQ